MAKTAQDKATERYRKQNVKSFNVKFFPADEETYEWLQRQESKNRYLKDLIKADMEGRISMTARKYSFESANMGTIYIEVTGEYTDGGKDIEAMIGQTGEIREWADMDGGGADEIFEWLHDRGVEFETTASLWFNVNYVASVMLDGDETRESLWATVNGKSEAELESWREGCFDF